MTIVTPGIGGSKEIRISFKKSSHKKDHKKEKKLLLLFFSELTQQQDWQAILQP